VIYLLVVGLGATAVVIITFPETGDGIDSAHATPNMSSLLPVWSHVTPEQKLILLAFAAGIAGSFLHAAQSLSSYIGNEAFKASWTTWYFLRPWIGGALGFAIYFALRAGLVAGPTAVNPYGVVALGLLGGWFSKTTTDKLQEVFETLFKTDQDKKRKDKLDVAERPMVKEIDPSPIPSNATDIIIRGQNFLQGATVQINNDELQADFVSETTLKLSLQNLSQRPAPGSEALIRVKNPQGIEPLSKGYKVLFQ
jgi:hypothetical protein